MSVVRLSRRSLCCFVAKHLCFWWNRGCCGHLWLDTNLPDDAEPSQMVSGFMRLVCSFWLQKLCPHCSVRACSPSSILALAQTFSPHITQKLKSLHSRLRLKHDRCSLELSRIAHYSDCCLLWMWIWILNQAYCVIITLNYTFPFADCHGPGLILLCSSEDGWFFDHFFCSVSTSVHDKICNLCFQTGT